MASSMGHSNSRCHQDGPLLVFALPSPNRRDVIGFNYALRDKPLRRNLRLDKTHATYGLDDSFQ